MESSSALANAPNCAQILPELVADGNPTHLGEGQEPVEGTDPELVADGGATRSGGGQEPVEGTDPELVADGGATRSGGGQEPVEGTDPELVADGGATRSGGGQEPVEGTDPCANLERRSEQIKCRAEQEAGRPACSANVPELEDRARLLTQSLRAKLNSYGDLLEEDLSDVSSRDLLCAFRIDELDQYYKRASEEPANSRATQLTAREIQDCQNNWQSYARERTVIGDVSPNLQDDVAKDLEAQLDPLQDQLEEFSKSIATLTDAAETIDGLILIHIDFCRAEGTQPATEQAPPIEQLKME